MRIGADALRRCGSRERPFDDDGPWAFAAAFSCFRTSSSRLRTRTFAILKLPCAEWYFRQLPGKRLHDCRRTAATSSAAARRSAWRCCSRVTGRERFSIATPAKSRILRIWRRERDSNPRNGFPFSGFQDHRHRPLGHPSAWPFYSDLRASVRPASASGFARSPASCPRTRSLASTGPTRSESPRRRSGAPGP